jgi:hypothetical protein
LEIIMKKTLIAAVLVSAFASVAAPTYAAGEAKT